MHRFFIKVPKWIQVLFSSYTWQLPTKEKTVYLTFDDGPHPEVTPWVLDLLAKYKARATFFCIGSNVLRYPALYERILAEGHAVGNHTHHHLNGWKTATAPYTADVAEAANVIDSKLFRPPYGRIRAAQARRLMAGQEGGFRVVMWDVLSADFDARTSSVQCVNNVLKNVEPGSIVVFHDSEKAYPNLRLALPEVLESLRTAGYACKEIAGKGR